MEPFLRNLAVGGGLLAVTALLALGRRRWWAAVLPLGGAVGLAVGLRWMPFEPLAGAPVPEVATLLVWVLMGCAARVARPMLPRNAGLAALIAGGLMGDIAAMVLLAPRAPDGRTAARMACVASAGALLSPIGTPATLLLVGPAELAPVAALLALVAWPGARRLDGSGSPTASILLVATAAAAAAWPHGSITAMAFCAALLAGLGLRAQRTLRLPWGRLLFLVAVSAVAWSARHAGLWEQAIAGVERVAGASWLDPALAAGAFLLAALVGEPTAALALASMLDTAAHPLPPLALPLALGVGVGGLGPLLLSGARVREALVPLSLQLAVAAACLLTMV